MKLHKPLTWVFILFSLDVAASSDLVCSLDRPLARPGEQVEVRVWSSKSRRLNWVASAGRVEASRNIAQWHLPNGTGLYTLTISAMGEGECLLRIFVDSSQRGLRAHGHGLLISREREPGGYGLYSYFLLGAPPRGQNRARIIEALEVFLQLSPTLEKMEQYRDRRELNANFLPVTDTPLQKPGAEWILRHYDYARARAMLQGLPGNHHDGPYLFSTLKPAGNGRTIYRPLLFQDLSSVPPHLVDIWYKTFLNQAAQEQFWQTDKLRLLTLNLRTVIGVLAAGLPQVKGAIDEWVSWLN